MRKHERAPVPSSPTSGLLVIGDVQLVCGPERNVNTCWAPRPRFWRAGLLTSHFFDRRVPHPSGVWFIKGRV
jgi:hypothetical protein